MRSYLSTVLLLAGLNAPSYASGLEDLAAKAAEKGEVIWYESSPTEAMQPVVDAFKKQYPNVALKHVRDTGGNGMAARIIQETQSGGRTADVASNGPPILLQLAQRDLLESVDWGALGVDKKFQPEPYAIATAATAYVIIYNNNNVSDADAPKTFDDLANERWAGTLGLWNRSESETSMASVWGEAKTTNYIDQLKKLNPMLFPSSFPMVQSLASGELNVGWGAHHAALPTMDKGGPIAVHIPDPLPVTTIYTFIPKAAKNPEGAKLFASWLTTVDGAVAYEKATGRGNLMVPETKYGQMASGKKIAEFSLSQHEEYSRLYEAYNAQLGQE